MSGWIGVDFDGTLAVYHGWGTELGAPVPLMLARVKAWIDAGREVRIVTARAAEIPGMESETAEQVELVKAWCREHLGCELQVTAQKDYSMVELWDDRAVAVVMNTGEISTQAATKSQDVLNRM